MSKFSPSQLKRLSTETLFEREKEAQDIIQFASSQRQLVAGQQVLANVMEEKWRRNNVKR